MAKISTVSLANSALTTLPLTNGEHFNAISVKIDCIMAISVVRSPSRTLANRL